MEIWKKKKSEFWVKIGNKMKIWKNFGNFKKVGNFVKDWKDEKKLKFGGGEF